MERAVWLRDFVLRKQLFDLAGTTKMTKAARWKDHLAAFNFEKIRSGNLPDLTKAA